MLVTKYVIMSSESNILPSDIAMKIYGSGYDVLVKETCFGVIINGEKEVVEALIKDIRTLDPAGIFIKDRGFPPGDPRRCRGRRGGGARPGFYMIESETKLLPMISRALAQEGEPEPIVKEKARPLPLKRLEEIVNEG
ncbi:MAG TPA: methanogenesis marker 6 protein [Methanothrix sp.]|jgi:putative methanogenesis marker protein 6|uniref:methanogenesis marker 6 protein n=1 Tax=Methanothrix sp. TaxID=90426 RepID=UPI002B9F77A5|nr:methanogenesis marker 6 protein [Methanothrix sp.]MDI9416428.1 methanogenesis marker 6 protein [Euryarchaeota archaeon]HON34790.1 methanogenesis marker 6 protein [Methanothrix sp.]HRU74647.1 methanogenesis marker 6 protein [Methanothrix sp.]